MSRRFLVVLVLVSFVLSGCVEVNAQPEIAGPSITSDVYVVDGVLGLEYLIRVPQSLVGAPAVLEITFPDGGTHLQPEIPRHIEGWVRVECGEQCYKFSTESIGEGEKMVVFFFPYNKIEGTQVTAVLSVYMDEYHNRTAGAAPVSQHLPYR